jgi:hypothetical protein
MNNRLMHLVTKAQEIIEPQIYDTPPIQTYHSKVPDMNKTETTHVKPHLMHPGEFPLD